MTVIYIIMIFLCLCILGVVYLIKHSEKENQEHFARLYANQLNLQGQINWLVEELDDEDGDVVVTLD